MASFIKKIHRDYRPKAFIKSNRLTKQLIFDTSALLSNNDELGMESLRFYVEFDYNTLDTSGLEYGLLNEFTSNGIDVENIQLSFHKSFDSTEILASMLNANLMDKLTYNETKIQIKRIQNLITNCISIDFLNDNELVTANVLLNLDGYNEHGFTYHYNTYYSFLDSSGNGPTFKLVKHGDYETKRAIRVGDHAYYVDLSGNYLQKNSDLSENFTFGDFDSKQLLQVYGYRIYLYANEEGGYEVIEGGNTIPNDYGLKLEVLPPFVEGLDLGLDPDGFTFTSNGIFTNIGIPPEEFTYDIYNYVEVKDTSGYQWLVNGDPDNYKEYAVNERYLILSNNELYFTYDNENELMYKFYDGQTPCS